MESVNHAAHRNDYHAVAWATVGPDREDDTGLEAWIKVLRTEVWRLHDLSFRRMVVQATETKTLSTLLRHT